MSINDAGQIAGEFRLPSGLTAGFIRSAKGEIETFNPGGAAGATVPTAMNESGMITGYYATTNPVPKAGDVFGPSFGFLRLPYGGIVTFSIPGSTYIYPQSINQDGEITGYYANSAQTFAGFVRSLDGNITTFNYQREIVPLSINAQGETAGWYGGPAGYFGFVRSAKGIVMPFAVPGLLQVEYLKQGSEGTLLGSYLTVTPLPFGQHGFLRSRDGEIMTFDLASPTTTPCPPRLMRSGSWRGTTTTAPSMPGLSAYRKSKARQAAAPWSTWSSLTYLTSWKRTESRFLRTAPGGAPCLTTFFVGRCGKVSTGKTAIYSNQKCYLDQTLPECGFSIRCEVGHPKIRTSRDPSAMS